MPLRKPMPSRERVLYKRDASRRFLRPWQVPMLSWLLERDLFALFVDPRLGKTLPVVRRLRMSEKRLNRILIAAPYSALFGWEETINGEGETDITYLTGEKDTRRNRLDTAGRWCLINKEGFRGLPEISRVNWDAVICDESTFLKNPKADISKFWVKHFRQARVRGILTGTPAPESELEYFQQFAFLDPAIIGYKNYYHFRNDWFVQPPRNFKWYLKYKGQAFLESKLKAHSFVLRRSEIRGDEKCHLVRKVPLPKDLQRIYRKVEQDFILELPQSGEERTTIWSMTQFLWMRNIASGIIEGDCVWPGKIQAVWEFVSGEMAGEKAVIWSAYTAEQDAILEYFREQGARTDIINGKRTPRKREMVRRAFQSGELDYVVAQPSCFRHGTDLSGADFFVYFSRPLGLETSQQSEDRIISMDIDRTVDIVDFVTEGTVDDSILKSLRRKENRSLMVLRIIQEAGMRCVA